MKSGINAANLSVCFSSGMIYADNRVMGKSVTTTEVKNELEILEKSRHQPAAQTQGTDIGSGKIPGGKPGV
jgi:hypothetical protein